jgi:hypothetical protein
MRGYLKDMDSTKKKLPHISRKQRRGGGGRYQPAVNRAQWKADAFFDTTSDAVEPRGATWVDRTVDQHGGLLIFPCVRRNYVDMRYCFGSKGEGDPVHLPLHN